MMVVAQLLLLLCSLQIILSVTPPQLPATFSSAVHITVSDEYGTHDGVGVWAVDQGAGMAVENYKFDNDAYDILDLQRYDLGMQYFLDPMNTSKCLSFRVEGKLPSVWDWVNFTNYVTSTTYNNESVDVWEATLGYANVQIAVSSNDTSVPIYLLRGSRGERNTTYEFLDWSSEEPSAKFFTVPSSCNTNSSSDQVSCTIQRATIMARAKVWVANHVPYNQGGTYQGYREDCSGYVSMCWASSQPGHATSTFYQIAHQISKSELQPGDCLLYASEHVVLFGGWLNSQQSQSYEETQPGEGTVTRPTPYPYWYSQGDFIPYRYNEVC